MTGNIPCLLLDVPKVSTLAELQGQFGHALGRLQTWHPSLGFFPGGAIPAI